MVTLSEKYKKVAAEVEKMSSQISLTVNQLTADVKRRADARISDPELNKKREEILELQQQCAQVSGGLKSKFQFYDHNNEIAKKMTFSKVGKAVVHGGAAYSTLKTLWAFHRSKDGDEKNLKNEIEKAQKSLSSLQEKYVVFKKALENTSALLPVGPAAESKDEMAAEPRILRIHHGR